MLPPGKSRFSSSVYSIGTLLYSQGLINWELVSVVQLLNFHMTKRFSIRMLFLATTVIAVFAAVIGAIYNSLSPLMLGVAAAYFLVFSCVALAIFGKRFFRQVTDYSELFREIRLPTAPLLEIENEGESSSGAQIRTDKKHPLD